MNNGSSCRGCQPEVPVMVGTVPDHAWGPNRRGERPPVTSFPVRQAGRGAWACHPASAAVDQVEGQGSDGGERCQRAQESERPGHGDPKRAPAGPMLDDPVEQRLFKADIVSHFFALNPLMTEDFCPFGQKFLIEG